MGWRRPQGSDIRPGCPIVVRYADDLVVCAHSREQAQQVKAKLAEWLAPRGLVFNQDKTRIVPLTEGFDFLGFNVRRYRNGKLLIKPSPAAVKRLRERLAAEMRALRGSNAAAVITALTPVIRGWAAYYRGVVSSEIFNTLDTYVWKLTYRWAKRSHPDKPKRWIVRRYFGRFSKARNDRWVCGNHLLTADQPPQSPQEWECWWLSVTRREISAEHLVSHDRCGMPDGNRTRLLHASCRRDLQARKRRMPARQPATPSGLA